MKTAAIVGIVIAVIIVVVIVLVVGLVAYDAYQKQQYREQVARIAAEIKANKEAGGAGGAVDGNGSNDAQDGSQQSGGQQSDNTPSSIRVVFDAVYPSGKVYIKPVRPDGTFIQLEQDIPAGDEHIFEIPAGGFDILAYVYFEFSDSSTLMLQDAEPSGDHYYLGDRWVYRA